MKREVVIFEGQFLPDEYTSFLQRGGRAFVLSLSFLIYLCPCITYFYIPLSYVHLQACSPKQRITINEDSHSFLQQVIFIYHLFQSRHWATVKDEHFNKAETVLCPKDGRVQQGGQTVGHNNSLLLRVSRALGESQDVTSP